jgi:transcriptional regulator
MYRPAHFAADDETTFAIVDAHPLAHLVVVADGEIASTPVPMIRRGDSLVGHLARGNPLWRHPGPALAIFTGVEAYVSPRFYASKQVDGRVVPTWNYTTVHARGDLVAHDDPAWLLELVTDLTDVMEASADAPWKVADAPTDYIEKVIRGIVGIELVGVTFEGKAKLSQNKADERERIIAGLALGTPTDQAVAAAMQD